LVGSRRLLLGQNFVSVVGGSNVSYVCEKKIFSILKKEKGGKE
jgi:hypothetical protein